MKNSNAEIASVGSRVPRDRATQSWPMVRLGDVCDEVRERIPSNEIHLAQYVTTDNMIKGCGGIKEAESLPVNVGLVHYHSGDVLVSNIRPYLKKTWLADRSGGCSSDVIVFRSNREDLASEYLYRVLSQDGFFDYSMQNVSGTKMPRGKRDWIKRFEFPLPPLPVQREIVARLEKELGDADALAAKFKEIAENADAEFKAELDETFKNVEGEKVRLGDVCDTVSTRGHQIKQSEIGDEGRFPVVSQSENDIEGYTNIEVQIQDVPLVLFGDHTCCAKLVEFPFVVGADGTKLIKSESVDIRYLFRFVQWVSNAIIDGKYRRHFADLMNSEIVISDNQFLVVSKLDEVQDKCEKLKAAAERGLRAAEDLRKAILAEAFEQ